MIYITCNINENHKPHKVDFVVKYLFEIHVNGSVRQ